MKISCVIVSGAMLVMLAAAGTLHSENVLTSQQVSNVLTFDKLDIKPQRITGVIVNKTPHTIRDIQLMIQYHWLWRDERNPGKDSPGRTVMFDLTEQLEPGESHAFIYTPQFNLPARTDGYFMLEVDVAAFTTVVQPARPAS